MDRLCRLRSSGFAEGKGRIGNMSDADRNTLIYKLLNVVFMVAIQFAVQTLILHLFPCNYLLIMGLTVTRYPLQILGQYIQPLLKV